MNKLNATKMITIKKPATTSGINLDFPIVRIGVKKSIAGMWPNAK